MAGTELLLLGGKPGSGKSTMAQTMIELKDAPAGALHLSVGEHLRGIGGGTIDSAFTEILAENTDTIAQDKSVPDEVTMGVIGEFITLHEDSGLVIIDGLRAPDSLDRFKSVVRDVGARVLAVCEAVVDDETVFERIRTRGQRYAKIAEDREFIKKRLLTYNECMVPTLDLMRQEYPYHALDGTQTAAVNATHLLRVYQEYTTA